MELIPNLWNDPAALRRLGVVLQWLAIVLVLLGALIQIGKLVLDVREKNLSTSLATGMELQRQERENQLKQELVDTKTKLVEAGRQADEAHNLAVQLEAKQKPRILSNESKHKFKKALEGTPRGKVMVSFKVSDDEARTFAMQIRDLLQSAGYETNPQNNFPWFKNDEPRIGIGIRIMSVETQPLYAGDLQRAFQAIGIEPILQAGAFDKDVPEIRVGSKP